MTTHPLRRLLPSLIVIGLVFSAVITVHANDAAPRVKVVRVAPDARIVKSAHGVDGTIHVLLNTEDGPQYVKSTDTGATFGTPIRIVDASSKKPGLKFQAEDLAVGKDGRVHVAMSCNAWQLKLPQEQWAFYYASLPPGATAFTPTRNLNRKPSEGFSLAADEQGNVTAWFLSGKLYSMVSRDNGETFTNYVEPNPAWNPCDCCTTASACGADGKVALLYREETDNQRDMFVVVSDQRGDSKPSRTRLSATLWKVNACPMTYFTIARAGDGYVAAWPTKGQVYFARLDKTGAVLPPGEIKTPGTSGMRNSLVALTASDGATLVAWKDKDKLGWQVYNPQGKPLAESDSAPSPGGGAAAVVLPSGNFIVFP